MTAQTHGVLDSGLDIAIKFANLWSTTKSGPSAGAAVASTLMATALKDEGCRIKHGVAITGEINLRGDILPVNDVVCKLKAAWKAGCEKVGWY